MGTITQRKATDGTIRYRAQVRAKRQGYPDFHQSRTFSKKSLATEWIKRLESEIERDPDSIFNPKAKKKLTLAKMIIRYLDEIDDFERSKLSALNQVAKSELGEKDVYTLTRQDFSDYAIARRKGDQDKLGVSPSTALKDFSHIAAVLNHADLVWGEKLENTLQEYNYSLKGLKRARIVTKSKIRDRLPTAEELQLLTTHFYKSWRRIRSAMPMHLIMWFSIYTGRREGEICRMLLSDYDSFNQQWKIRDVKNPEGSAGNHKFAHLEPLAIDMIDEFFKPEVRNRILSLEHDDKYLIPVNPATVSTYFTRACDMCGIEDLRFHDLRHEAASRYAEDGFTIPQLQTITLHDSWSSLKRYVNLKKRGQRLEFREALRIAEENYNDFYKEHSKKQRYISLNDREAGVTFVDKRLKENHHLRQLPAGRRPKIQEDDID